MKKNFRRAMAAVMAAALTLSLAGTAADADAAKKKKIKLASKSVTVNVKKSKTVKIKNVKAKKVKKLTVKSASKKIATAKAKGKTAVKVTGKKAGKSTKVKITLKIKGQKKATKLTLKVKVSKKKPPVPGPATNAPAPATNAPAPATDAPAVSQPPQGGDASQAPATQKPSDKPKASKTPKPEWTPDPGKKVEDVTISYGDEGFLFEKADMVKFADAPTGYPKDGIDVRYYDKVIVHYTSDVEIAAKEDGENGSWGGKATLSTTDEGYGMNGFSNGLYRWYLNDMKYENGGYAVEYSIQDKTLIGKNGGLQEGFDFDEVGAVDCVSVQLNYPYVNSEDGSEKGVNFRLRSIEFKAPAASANPSAKPSMNPGDPSAKPSMNPNDPSAKPSTNPDKPTDPSAKPTATPTAPALTLTVTPNQLLEGETAAVDIPAVAGVTVAERNLTVSGTGTATLNDDQTVLTAVTEGTVTVSGTIKATVSGVPFTVNVTSGDVVIDPKDKLVANVTVDTPSVELLVGGKTTPVITKTATMNRVPVTDATYTVTWATVDTAVVDVDKNNGEITAKAPGTAKVKVTVVAKQGTDKVSAPKTAEITVKVYGDLIVKTAAIEFPNQGKIAMGESVKANTLTEKAVTSEEEIEITNVIWAIVDTAGAETAATEIAAIDRSTGVITGKKTGTANVKAIVTVKGALDRTEQVTVTGQIQVTNTTCYVINKEIALAPKDGADVIGQYSGHKSVALGMDVPVKKTDKVEVVFSVKSGDSDDALTADTTNAMEVFLSNYADASNPWDVADKGGIFKMSGGDVAGKYQMVVDKNFLHNNDVVKSVAAQSASDTGKKKVVVTIEKIFVTPTDEVALSVVKKPAVLEEGTQGEIEVEVDDGYTLVWTSEDETIATVAAVVGTQTKATVTGVKAGAANIKCTVKSSDGKTVKDATVKFDVKATYKNTPVKLDLSKFAGDGAVYEEGKLKITDKAPFAFELDNTLAKDDRLRIQIKANYDAGAEIFRVMLGKSLGNGDGGTPIVFIPGSGAIDEDQTLTMQADDITHLTITGNAWGVHVKNITISEITITYL